MGEVMPEPSEFIVSPANTTEFAGILGGMSANIANLTGVIKEQGTKLDRFDERLRKVETTVETLQATRYVEKPKTPWYAVVAGVVGILTGIGLVITLVGILAQLASL